MPIDSEEFAKGRKITGIEREVLQFLKQSKKQAFTQPEIIGSLYSISTASFGDVARSVLIVVAVERALEKLVKEGSVSAKQIDRQTYYMAT